MARIDYNRAAAAYDEGRARPPDELESWRDALADYLPAGPEGPVLDLGAGTGIWAGALAGWFSVRVVAVEPSTGMRARARAKGIPSHVALLAGDGQAIPVRDASCQAAWLSTVIHHIPDLHACAAELGRVLRSGAPALIRSSFPGRHDQIPLFSFFPGAKAIADTFPTVEATEAAFAAAGFEAEGLRRVQEQRDADMAAAVKRVRALRYSDSTLVPLSEEEFDVGLTAMEQAAAGGAAVPETGLDLLVLRASRIR